MRGEHCKHWERRLSSAVLGMNKIGLLLLPVLALFALPLGSFAQEVDPSEVFLKAYMTAQQGEKLERENQLQAGPRQIPFRRFDARGVEEKQRRLAAGDRRVSQPQNRRGDPAGPEQDRTQTDLAATAQPGPTEIEEAAPPNVASSGADVWRSVLQPARPNPVEVRLPSRTRPRSCAHVSQALETELKKSQRNLDSAKGEIRDLKQAAANERRTGTSER